MNYTKEDAIKRAQDCGYQIIKMQITTYWKAYGGGIESRMRAENAANNSPDELQRTLGECVRGDFLVKLANAARDNGIWNFETTVER